MVSSRALEDSLRSSFVVVVVVVVVATKTYSLLFPVAPRSSVSARRFLSSENTASILSASIDDSNTAADSR